MKKLLFIALSLLSATLINAQEPADALRFAWTVPGATARVQAIGGAQGSLGGDISSTFMNPAGLAFYKTGDVVISQAYRFGKAKSTYFGRTEEEKKQQFTWGTSGFVFGGVMERVMSGTRP